MLKYKKKKEGIFTLLVVSSILVSVCYATIQGDYDNNNQLDLKDCIAILKIIDGFDPNDNILKRQRPNVLQVWSNRYYSRTSF